MTAEHPTQQLIVHCEKCGREQWLGWLPMPMTAMAAVLKSARCSCGAAPKRMVMGPTPKPTAEGDPLAWIVNGDTGASSETVWGVMMGRPIRRADIPYDPSDFGRCYRLLRVMPSWRARLSEVAEAYPEWRPFVNSWDELTALYEEERPSGVCPKLYARMKELRADV